MAARALQTLASEATDRARSALARSAPREARPPREMHVGPSVSAAPWAWPCVLKCSCMCRCTCYF